MILAEQKKKNLFVKKLANYPWHFKCLNCPWSESVKNPKTWGHTLPIDLLNFTYSDSRKTKWVWAVEQSQHSKQGKQCEEPVYCKAANFVSQKNTPGYEEARLSSKWYNRYALLMELILNWVAGPMMVAVTLIHHSMGEKAELTVTWRAPVLFLLLIPWAP